MRLIRLLTLVLAVGLLFVAAPALAQEANIEIPLDPATGDPGDVVEVGTGTVPEGSVGAEFEGEVDVSALAEAFEGNTLQLETGGNTYEIDGVEDVPGGEPLVFDGVITAGEEITISVILGEGGTFAGGETVTLTAAEAAAAAETPAGGVATGAGGTAGNDAFPLAVIGLAAAAVAALSGGYLLMRRSHS